ncbi:MBL fold metallo-hydrolase [Fodinibius sediminis]|uniref:Hydroxyacylglutathione hydrolase n=1 Tax=Fodinibius sediminis TaxID=1214077 RepID=A0A521C8U0_9BACT|nr:MBL fold metallo-hydrolase [Fodinibius sediminis]SMO55130.1 hydroxyacylglutathione hydrolase [Fodinibius sediminis]
MYFKQLYEQKLSQYAYLIGCQQTGEAIIVDPMRDIDQYVREAEQQDFTITAAVDTHIHADYISGLREFAARGIKVYASDEGGEDWKYEWLIDSDYDFELLKDGDTFSLGNIKFDVVYTPGHTPESLSFLVTDGDATDQPMGMLTGDFVFVGDVGRPDLLETAAGQVGAMKPAARELYKSVEEFKGLPEYLQVWPAHGSGSACGKALGAVPESTVGYELRFSPAFKASGSEQEFVDFILDGQPEPPLYFGRMKQVNKEGPALLGELPQPGHMTVDELMAQEGVIIDSRDKHSFMKDGHLPGSLLSTFEDEFNTIAGSYVEADSDIYLIVEKVNVEQAVRDLIRVGLDNIRGFATPDDLESWSGTLEYINAIDFDEAENLRMDNHKQVLDVRKATEYEEGHIPGALNIAHTRLAVHLDDLPRDKELLVHCASGRRASYASALLARAGFQVQWIDDDFEKWEQENAKSAEG